MNTLHLKYAVEIEKTGSITQAAENLFMGQPTLSKNIKELESNLGITIFKRTTKGVTPTKKGAEFLKYAKNILAQIDEIENLHKSGGEKKQRFNVVVPRVSYISKALVNFIKNLDSSKNFEINYKETNSIRAINKVFTGEYNLGIIRYQTVYENYFTDFLKDKNIKAVPVWEFECLALMDKNHPLAETDELKYDDLSKCTEIVHGDNTVPYLSAGNVRFSDSASKRIYIYERGSQFDLLAGVRGTFMWVSPLPEEMLEKYSLVQRKCSFSNGKYKDSVIYSNDYELTKQDKMFLQELEKSKNELTCREYF